MTTLLDVLEMTDDPDTPYYPEVEIGTIDGCPVLASYLEDGAFCAVEMTWNGLNISTNGKSSINLGNDGQCCIGDISLAQWGCIRELVHTDVMEQLITLARKHARLTADERSIASC